MQRHWVCVCVSLLGNPQPLLVPERRALICTLCQCERTPKATGRGALGTVSRRIGPQACVTQGRDADLVTWPPWPPVHSDFHHPDCPVLSSQLVSLTPLPSPGILRRAHSSPAGSPTALVTSHGTDFYPGLTSSSPEGP